MEGVWWQCYWSSRLQISVPYGADRRPLCVPAPGAQFTFTQPLFPVFADGRTDGPAGAEASGKRRLNLDKNASSLGGGGGATCSHQTNKAPRIKIKADVLTNMMAALHSWHIVLDCFCTKQTRVSDFSFCN